MEHLKIKNLFSVQNKIVVITGGSSGLGLMMVNGFRRNGAIVISCGRKDGVEVSKLFPPFLDSKRFRYIRTDITKEEEVDTQIDYIQEHEKKVDVLINNAGISPSRDSKEFDSIINTNIKAMIQLSNKFLPLLSNMSTGKYSKIINMSSIAGIHPTALKNYGYTISKSGVITFTKQFAKEVIDKRILVNAIAPGFFYTPMTKPVLDRFSGKIINTIPIRRLGRINDIVGTALFLASNASDYITGETIILDGGMINAS